jgi:LPS-assembly lipoprotein
MQLALIKLRPLVAVALSLVIAGCGYQLRGTGGLPDAFSHVFVQARSTQMRHAMEQLLEANGATLVPRSDAQVSILVTREDLKERLLSVDPNTGRAREFEIAYIANFSVRDNAGKAVVENERMQIVRDYVFDVDAVIGKSRERGVLYAEMRRDVALQIFNRIRAVYPRG